jgi:hypothetical protein
MSAMIASIAMSDGAMRWPSRHCGGHGNVGNLGNLGNMD